MNYADLTVYFVIAFQHDARIVQQFRRLEDMTEGRTRSYTDADGCSLIKQEKSDIRSPIFVKQQPSLRRGTLCSVYPTTHRQSCLESEK